ncbi:MAG: hypothetical protein JSS86_14720 [Cyanobacteria bacterium SZAS LIN-2]|nr:hypothetical protein [Cyanobacteria bacterium SZAS LIN-2]
MLLDKYLTDEELLSGLAAASVTTEPTDPNFWKFLERFQPYCFVSASDTLFFAAHNKDLVASVHSDRAWADAESQERAYKSSSRAALWRDLGPECGPEKCVEPDCNRLRIKLAMRCFMHQMN